MGKMIWLTLAALAALPSGGCGDRRKRSETPTPAPEPGPAVFLIDCYLPRSSAPEHDDPVAATETRFCLPLVRSLMAVAEVEQIAWRVRPEQFQVFLLARRGVDPAGVARRLSAVGHTPGVSQTLMRLAEQPTLTTVSAAGGPRIDIRLDPAKAARLGISVQDIYSQLAARLTDGTRTINITAAPKAEDLARVIIRLPSGEQRPLRSVATFHVTTSLGEVTRPWQTRAHLRQALGLGPATRAAP